MAERLAGPKIESAYDLAQRSQRRERGEAFVVGRAQTATSRERSVRRDAIWPARMIAATRLASLA